MADSRQGAAIDQLVALFAAGLTAGSVIDGPYVTGAEPTKRIYVGYDGDPGGDWAAATSDQSWAGTLGANQRDEKFSVTCAVVCRSGAGNVKAARDAAYAVLAEASDILRANVTLGFPPPSNAQVRNPSLSYAADAASGIEARIAFDVEVSTRI